MSNPSINLRKLCTIGMGLWLASYATASMAQGTSEQRAACTPDVFRLCSSAIPDVDRIIACMKANKNSLSTACKAATYTIMVTSK